MTKPAYCGLICENCDAFIAYKNDDQALREKTAAFWSKEYGAEINPNDINCVGCLTADGVHISHCAECKIKACAEGKGLDNCGLCKDYPCDKVNHVVNFVPEAKQVLDQIHAEVF